MSMTELSDPPNGQVCLTTASAVHESVYRELDGYAMLVHAIEALQGWNKCPRLSLPGDIDYMHMHGDGHTTGLVKAYVQLFFLAFFYQEIVPKSINLFFSSF